MVTHINHHIQISRKGGTIKTSGLHPPPFNNGCVFVMDDVIPTCEKYSV